MSIQAKQQKKTPKDAYCVFVLKSANDLKNLPLKTDEYTYCKSFFDDVKRDEVIVINRFSHKIFILLIKLDAVKYKSCEKFRIWGSKIFQQLKNEKLAELFVEGINLDDEFLLAFQEGFILGSYRFNKYKKNADERASEIKAISIITKKDLHEAIDQINITSKAVFIARDMVNEPPCFLTAKKLADWAVELAKESGMKIEIFEKSKIEALKMNGLLAVNKGSDEPPTFITAEWKPKDAINKKPYVFVGKGIMFDTGGISIKPSTNMEEMKCDMAGAASVINALYATALCKLPIWAVALVPATDNKPDAKAYVPSDIITFSNGISVEVISTDAEGRLILADALLYAQKLNPKLVINIATLTGSAHAAIGKYGIVAMQSNAEKDFATLLKSGYDVYERLVEFPFWDEYGDLIKSEFADIKNVGGKYAGAITAGKFLEKFTDYPFIHLDIAGPSFLEKGEGYKTTGGSGVGVRLFFDFLLKKCK